MSPAAPFPGFGGKRRVAALAAASSTSARCVQNYVEPFAGSLAVLLGRPLPFSGPETVNDRDRLHRRTSGGRCRPTLRVAAAADWPVNENDQHARACRAGAGAPALTARLEGDPTLPRRQDRRTVGVGDLLLDRGRLVLRGRAVAVSTRASSSTLGTPGRASTASSSTLGTPGGASTTSVHPGDAGRGVHRQLVHLGAPLGRRPPPARPPRERAGAGRRRAPRVDGDLGRRRLRRVRVCCGDWSRVCGPTPTVKQGAHGGAAGPALLQRMTPASPISTRSTMAGSAVPCAPQALEWEGADPRLRIALCGYQGDHAMPADWTAVPWKSSRGYGSGREWGWPGECRSAR